MKPSRRFRSGDKELPSVHWRDLSEEMFRFHNEMSKLMDKYFSSGSLFRNGQFLFNHSNSFPSFQLTEKKKEYVLEAKIPDLRPEDINIVIQDHTISIKGEKQEKITAKNDKNNAYMMQSHFASFYRSFHLPDDSDVNNIKIDKNQGVLIIRVPKWNTSSPKQKWVNTWEE